MVVVVREQDVDAVAKLGPRSCADDQEVALVTGGATRHASEQRGLAVLARGRRGRPVDVVVVHDAARPLADAALFDAVVAAAHADGGAVPVRPQRGLVDRDGCGT